MEDSKLKSFFARMKGPFSRKVFAKEKWIILSLSMVLFSVVAFGVYASQNIPLTVNLNGDVKEVVTSADEVGELLDEMDVDYHSRDELSHRLNEKIESGMTLTWKKAFQVVLNKRGEEEKVWTTADTVEELLADQQVTLQEGDVVAPVLQSELEPHTFVEVAHYETDIVEDEYEISYETIRKEDPTILKGEERVLASGREGKGVNKYEVTYKNGKEIHRELIDREQTQEKEDRLIAVGTKEPESQPEQKSNARVQVASADQKTSTKASASSSKQSASGSSSTDSGSSSSSSADKGKVMQVQSTAYTANCSGCSGITATGINLKANPNKKVIAVDPNVIPLGSTVEVEGYGTAIAADTGGHIQGKRIDVHVPSKDAAFAWGQRTVTIRIVD